MSSYIGNLMQMTSIQKRNREYIFLATVVLFALACRVLSFEAITLITLILLGIFLSYDFYGYVNHEAKTENKTENILEFSWGYVKEKKDNLDVASFFKYLAKKDFVFYRIYTYRRADVFILGLFIFGDLVVAFKNLDFYYSGIYIALSVFTKFVYFGYILLNENFDKLLHTKDELAEKKEERILNIFYTQMNTMISMFFVLFIMFFILSRYIVEIFFGSTYFPYHTSLPFVLLANIMLCISLCVYSTAKKIDPSTTSKISKIYTSLFLVLFVFMSINYVDTITYFIVGSSSILSIFLYNFVIKKPEYIRSTYNHLF